MGLMRGGLGSQTSVPHPISPAVERFSFSEEVTKEYVGISGWAEQYQKECTERQFESINIQRHVDLFGKIGTITAYGEILGLIAKGRKWAEAFLKDTFFNKEFVEKEHKQWEQNLQGVKNDTSSDFFKEPSQVFGFHGTMLSPEAVESLRRRTEGASNFTIKLFGDRVIIPVNFKNLQGCKEVFIELAGDNFILGLGHLPPSVKVLKIHGGKLKMLPESLPSSLETFEAETLQLKEFNVDWSGHAALKHLDLKKSPIQSLEAKYLPKGLVSLLIQDHQFNDTGAVVGLIKTQCPKIENIVTGDNSEVTTMMYDIKSVVKALLS